MKLYITEKPSQANDIAAVLGITSRGDGYLVVKGGDKVTFARGHLYELAEPGDYVKEWAGRWDWSQLPMLPQQFKLKLRDGAKTQLNVIRKLLKEADEVVIATDAGREGEVIGREILQENNFRGKVLRFWTSTLTKEDIAKALSSLRTGDETLPLYEAGLARSHSDWLWGLTLTRAATLSANKRGDYFPVGRVQTATLALVVSRTDAVRNFVPEQYFELEASVQTSSGETFTMMHAPEGDKRIRSKAQAQELLERASRFSGPLRVSHTNGTEAPPLPFSLPALQKEANRLFGFSAKRTLELAQALYEAKAASYPRTDCSYLGTSQRAEVPGVLACLAKHFPEQTKVFDSTGPIIRNAVFDDARLVGEDHHAIVPTAAYVKLDGQESQLFKLIAQRYLQVLSPDYQYAQTTLSLDANGVPFRATGRTPQKLGWRQVTLLGDAEPA